MDTGDLLAAIGEYNNIQTQEFTENQECQIFLTNKKGINILQLNIRSIKRNFDELNLLLESLGTNNLDIIILSETWQITSENYFKIPNFQMFYNNAKFNKNDGLLIYIHNKIYCTTKHYTINNITFTRALFQINNITCGITSLYRPPSTNVLQFLDDFKAFLQNNSSQMLEIILGDINIDILSKDDISNSYLNSLASLGFISYINIPTRICSTAKTCLDHIFIKGREHKSISNIQSAVYNSTITDHYTVLLTIELQTNSSIKNNRINKDSVKKEIDLDKLKRVLELETWDDVLHNENVDEMTNSFISKLKNYISTSTNIVKKNNKFLKLKPWITIGLIKSINKRNKLKKIYLRDKDNIDLKNNYKRYRNTLNTLLTKTKHDFYSNKVKEADKNIKKIWEIVKELENNNSKHKEISIQDGTGNIIINDDLKIADMFNEHYINIGAQMANDLQPNTYNIRINKNQNAASLFLRRVDEQEIILKISELKNNSSSGKDGISTKIIKHIHLSIIKPLVHIINNIFSSGIVPRAFKESVVVPIHKCESRLEIVNYRPISLISNIAKIFEKCFKQRLSDFLNKFNMLSSNQFGFRSNKNTETAIFELINLINESLNKNEKCLAIFLDLAKAFDTVPHSILLNRAESMGIRGKVLEILKNYLKDRVQYVKINNTLSKPLIIKTGVPQGTVLGPILFLIYIDQITRIDNNASIISYADDTVLVFRSDNWEKVYKTASIGLSAVNCWLDNSLLTLNHKKTKFMTFSVSSATQNDISNIIIHKPECLENDINDCHCLKEITSVENIKYLGIVLDRYLKWKPHIEFLNSRIRKCIYLFYKLREYLNTRTLEIVYKAIIESVIKYGIIVWGGLYESSLNSLKVTQNTIIKVMYKKNKRYPTNQLYLVSKIFNIRLLYIQSAIIFIHIQNNRFQQIPQLHVTRAVSNENLTIKKFEKTLCQRFITYFGLKFYNFVPIDIRNIKKIPLFKKKIHEFLLKNANRFYSLL